MAESESATPIFSRSLSANGGTTSTPPVLALSNTSCNSFFSSSSVRFARLRRSCLPTDAAIFPAARLQ